MADFEAPIRRSLADVVDIVGQDVAVALVQALPGVEIYVPTPARLTADHVLAMSLGIDKATRLAESFGGDRVLVTKTLADESRARRETILRMRKAGAKARDIALATGCTQRFVRLVANGRPGDDGQGSLF